ncbi:hypothetical protein QZH41_014903, partial [Actinostola sp. cb2023]
VLWAKAKEEGMNVVVNWQDADSSSAKGFRYSYHDETESKIMLCAGHVGRAHGNKLQDLQKTDLRVDAWDLDFILAAKCNHFCAVVQAGNDPDKYRRTMLTLGKYHSRDIHEWEGGCCEFHPLVKCSCKGCDVDEHGFCPDMKCSGEQYHSSHVLKCDFHGLAYEIECAQRAKKAEEVIDSSLGKGHSNLPESTFSVLTKFRAKDINLHQTHYQASTNLGLLQSSMTWCYKNRGPEYHWIIELYSRMGLPVFDGIQQMCQDDNKQRMVKLGKKQTLEGKRGRIQLKVNRVEEQKIRKRYTKSCQIRHTYGEDDDEQVLEEDVLLRLTERAIEDGTAPTLRLVDSAVLAPEGATVSIGGKRCKSCGSTSHMRSSHKDCPNNKKKKRMKNINIYILSRGLVLL